MTYIFFFKEEPVRDIFDTEDYPSELIYHLYDDTYNINTSRCHLLYKLKVYIPLNYRFSKSSKEYYERLKIFHRTFTKQIQEYKDIHKTFDMSMSTPSQYVIFDFLPNQLFLDIVVSKEFKELFLVIPYEKFIRTTLFDPPNFKVEISYEGKTIGLNDLLKYKNDYFLDMFSYEMYDMNSLQVLMDEQDDKKCRLHNTKSLFE